MRFIGNKEKLVANIYEILLKHNVIKTCDTTKSFFDMFAGSTSVGRFFKMKGFSITSCDLLYLSYCLQRAYLQNNKEPRFRGLKDIVDSKRHLNRPYEKVLAYLNSLESKRGFIYQNYAPSGSKNLATPRQYFSDYNACKIDAIRLEIEKWHIQDKISENEYFILLATLLESISLFANVAGVYAAFCKIWDKRALKPFNLKQITLLESDKQHICLCANSTKILQDAKQIYDLIYLDPPYNQRQYAPNYHLLETIARYDNPSIKGVAGLREWQGQKSRFCNKQNALAELETIMACKNFKTAILSYNSEGLMKKDEINEILKPHGAVIFEEMSYPRFKSNQNKGKKFISEYVWVIAK